jgi:L-alanine-DL-glutamate epimerase-like enolase superfamily enzyme
MKIVDVKATPIWVIPSRGRINMLVEIITDQGLIGIGEAEAGRKPGEIAIGIKALIEKGYKQVLLGEDPTNFRPLYDKMLNYSWYSENGLGMAALSGVDMALIDLTGKILKVPACKLFGGCYRNKVRAYASHPIVTPKSINEVITESLDLIDKGFTGIKFSFSWWKDFGKNLKEDMGIVRKIRTEIGYDIDMMISENAPNRGVSKAIRIAKALEEFDLLFWEDALPRGEIDQYAALSAAVDLPIEVGEKVNNQMLKYFILRKAVDAINPEITNTCLSETKKLADLAYLQGIMTYPHNHGSILSVAAITQLVASMPDGDLIEYRTSDIDDSMTALLLEKLSPEKGYIEVPQKPGLGIELDQNVVKKLEWDGSKISDIDSKIHDYPRW